MSDESGSYEAVYDRHTWDIPEYFNMGVDVCDRHVATQPDHPALIVVEDDDDDKTFTFAEMRDLSNQLANALEGLELCRGDRLGILLSQSVEAALSHIATWKLGGISIPLFTLFGEDALKFRLQNSGAKILVTDKHNLKKVEAIWEDLSDLKTVLVIDASTTSATVVDFWKALENASKAYTPIRSKAEDPAFILYTSGTTGNPKGALHAHRALLGHLSGMELFHDFFPQPDDRIWTPADWAWIGGLMNCLMCAWHHGITNVAFRAKKFDPEHALRLMAKYKIRNVFLPPTAMNLMRNVTDISRFGVNLRTIAVAGEPMGAELLDWGREHLGITCNEFYGQTECNLIVTNCQKIMPVKPGSMGRPAPGHRVDVIDANGDIVAPGIEGEIAVKAPDPVMLLKYWDNPEATKNKYRKGWLLTGDNGKKDDDGYLWFVGRADDVITSAGYRIGPGEIEDCLCTHPAVSLAAAIGVPDPIRTEIVKVFILLNTGHEASQELKDNIQAHVKTRLSPHEYPRLIEFVDALPLTATNKIKRKVLRDAELEKAAP